VPPDTPNVRRILLDRRAATAVPDPVREEAQRRLEEIAEGLQRIPPESPFWESVRVSRLCLVVRGYSFYYTLDEDTLRVTDVRR
jgi:hypothetical protein